jgi:hypothetical protein
MDDTSPDSQTDSQQSGVVWCGVQYQVCGWEWLVAVPQHSTPPMLSGCCFMGKCTLVHIWWQLHKHNIIMLQAVATAVATVSPSTDLLLLTTLDSTVSLPKLFTNNYFKGI